MSKIKFSFIYVLYLLIFWISPFLAFNVDSFFIELQNLLSIIGLGNFNSFLVYFVLIVPLMLILIKMLILKNYSKPLFIFLFIIIPYALLISFLVYGYYHLFDNFTY